jgi:AcrR family transcriptional regulator
MSPRRTSEATREMRASLVEHARRVVERDGAEALTMRALAAEAGCAVGLPYKIFDNREDLIVELLLVEFRRLRASFDELVARAGTGTVAENLAAYARVFLGSATPAVSLAWKMDGEALSRAIDAKAHESGLLASFETTVADYLAAEKRLERVDAAVDERAFGFLITGAVHNLIVSGEAYPRPDLDEVERMLAAVADRLAPRPGR